MLKLIRLNQSAMSDLLDEESRDSIGAVRVCYFLSSSFRHNYLLNRGRITTFDVSQAF